MAELGAPTVRRFASSDAPQIAVVFRTAILDIDPELYTSSQLEAWAARSDAAELAERCASALTWVVEVDDVVVGFIACETDGHIDLAFVHPEHQGRGLARILYGAMEAEARGRGWRRLFTEASHAARPFFERAGYRVVARNEVRVGDETLVNWSMEKLL